MNQNYFQGKLTQPYHISIGGVVLNSDGLVCCHYFDSLKVENQGTIEDLILLMRETIEPNESIEKCLARGLMEEFGMKASLRSYIGSIVSSCPMKDSDVIMEKTTLYFLCDFISMDESLRKEGDIEAQSVIKWFEPKELIIRMKEQGKRLGRNDADESSVIERAFGF